MECKERKRERDAPSQISLALGLMTEREREREREREKERKKEEGETLDECLLSPQLSLFGPVNGVFCSLFCGERERERE